MNFKQAVGSENIYGVFKCFCLNQKVESSSITPSQPPHPRSQTASLLKHYFHHLSTYFNHINRHTIRLLRNAEICIFLKELFIVPLLRWNVYMPIIQLPKSNKTFSHSMRNPGTMFRDETRCRGFVIIF